MMAWGVMLMKRTRRNILPDRAQPRLLLHPPFFRSRKISWPGRAHPIAADSFSPGSSEEKDCVKHRTFKPASSGLARRDNLEENQLYQWITESNGHKFPESLRV